MHCCLFDRLCWRDWWRYGAPMRLYWTERGGTDRFVSLIPSRPVFWLRWRNAEPVHMVFPEHAWMIWKGPDSRVWSCAGREPTVEQATRVCCRTCGVLTPEDVDA